MMSFKQLLLIKLYKLNILMVKEGYNQLNVQHFSRPIKTTHLWQWTSWSEHIPNVDLCTYL